MDTIEKFYSTYPEINPEWLLTGQGPMLKEPTPEDKQSKLQKIREIADTPTKKNNLIPFYEDVATQRFNEGNKRDGTSMGKNDWEKFPSR